MEEKNACGYPCMNQEIKNNGKVIMKTRRKEIVCPACNQANCYGHYDYEFECDCGMGNSRHWFYGNTHHELCNKLTKLYAPAKGTTP